MNLSIIIPTAGRPVAIRAAIRSLLEIPPEQKASEILVVDNNTDEEFAADLRKYCALLDGEVRYVRQPSPGLTAARHRGISESRGEILIFVDDDVEVSGGWLEAIRTGFLNPDVGMIGGPSIPRFTGSVPNWFWSFLSRSPYGGWMCPWLSLLDIGRDVKRIDPSYIWGLNFSIRRSVVERCGGFHPDLVPTHLQRWQGDGETGLTKKVEAASVRADYLQSALLFHRCGPERLNQDYFKRRAYYQGVAESFSHVRSGRDPRRDSLPPELHLPHRRLAAAARAMVQRLSGSTSWRSAEVSGMLKATGAARIAGWQFHQAEVASDPRLLAWVRRPDFTEADIRTELPQATSQTSG